MIQRPVAVGLKVCQHAIVDAHTKLVSLVNCISQLRFHDFPAPPQPFMVCAVLNDGLGEVEFALYAGDEQIAQTTVEVLQEETS